MPSSCCIREDVSKVIVAMNTVYKNDGGIVAGLASRQDHCAWKEGTGK